jgi:hypothetical protein
MDASTHCGVPSLVGSSALLEGNSQRYLHLDCWPCWPTWFSSAVQPCHFQELATLVLENWPFIAAETLLPTFEPMTCNRWTRRGSSLDFGWSKKCWISSANFGIWPWTPWIQQNRCCFVICWSKFTPCDIHRTSQNHERHCTCLTSLCPH